MQITRDITVHTQYGDVGFADVITSVFDHDLFIYSKTSDGAYEAEPTAVFPHGHWGGFQRVRDPAPEGDGGIEPEQWGPATSLEGTTFGVDDFDVAGPQTGLAAAEALDARLQASIRYHQRKAQRARDPNNPAAHFQGGYMRAMDTEGSV